MSEASAGRDPSALVMTRAVADLVVAHCLASYPEEGCGLVVGDSASGLVERCVPARNQAASARVYTLDPRDHLRIDREAESDGLAVIGVFHSHTHTDPYPSPTDVAQAPDPSWHYVLVSLRHELASIRSYRIVDGIVAEEPILERGEADRVPDVRR